MSRIIFFGLKLCGLLSLLFLTGCGPLISLGENGPAPRLYSLRYPVLSTEVAAQGPLVYVSSPEMSGALGGKQVTVALDGNENTALDGVKWSADLADMIRDYVSQSLSVQTRATIFGQEALDVQVGCRLGVKVWNLEFTPGERWQDDAVHVSLQFLLVRMADSQLLGQQMFTVTEDVGDKGHANIMDAFNRAMFKTAETYGPWFGQRLEACQ